MKRLVLLLCFTFFILNFSFAQDSCNLRISLLTCSPGEELYTTFGHTALRVQDKDSGTDYVFNYGTFEFGPDFYSKFIRGKLLYSLSVENFTDFMYEFQVERRTVREQLLQVSCAEKQRLYTALKVNAEEQNRYYRYDFLFDNCTTRAKNIVEKNTSVPVVYKNILPEDIPTFRDLIHSYLDAGHEYWSKLGIDILLGAKLDKKVTNEQAMFLPDYLLKGFDSALVNGHPLVKPPQSILQMPAPVETNTLFSPGIVFSVLFIIVAVLSFVKRKWTATAVGIFDFLLFLILGCAGLLILFMWFGTDHKVCQNNFNLLWALPAHVVMAFFVHRKALWVRKYFKFTGWLSLLSVIVLFQLIPQQINNAILPLTLLVGLRSLMIAGRR